MTEMDKRVVNMIDEAAATRIRELEDDLADIRALLARLPGWMGGDWADEVREYIDKCGAK